MCCDNNSYKIKIFILNFDYTQGTWNDTRHNFATNYGQAQSSPQYYDQPTAYGEGQQQQQQPHGEGPNFIYFLYTKLNI